MRRALFDVPQRQMTGAMRLRQVDEATVRVESAAACAMYAAAMKAMRRSSKELRQVSFCAFARSTN